jgi:mono/diheme cytochrome c family protein
MDDPFGPPAAGVSVELDQLAAYVDSLTEVPRSPFRNPDGSLTDAARRGRTIFERSGCPACHGNAVYTDSADGMLHDVGTVLPTSGDRLGGPLEGIDTPTLMGLWATPPYLHDGRAPTIQSIFTEHNPDDRIGRTSHLDAEELADLEAYMMQLDGSEEPPPPAEQGCRTSGRRPPPWLLLLCLLGARRRFCRR